ncbi:beta-lactamase family protein [Thalassotalea sp. M1531]|uniref:Beta-lactamase family protein n=1 Tax=Thalassotalea algicola TaxID=2716224 RepID=A0A7Y0LDU3_9GAMM|nr:serine hydrolase domain-containing protein [Thalassotalea algicola]NMP32724.1 beta-lactamase family protein [Thalassotalea algicola]
MNLLSKITLFLFVILSAGCGGGSDGNSKSTNEPPVTNTPTSIQQILDEAITNGVDGIFVYIDQPGKVNQSFTAGIQDRNIQLPANAESLFKIASISKLFIAVTAVKLSFSEQLSLNDSLAYWLPELANRIENSSVITVKHLIQHRSGIADFDSQVGFSWQDAHVDIDQTLAFALDKPADFTPNSDYEYSNTNYLLLAKILDRALGYSHQIYISEQILTPLVMADTYAQLSDIDKSLLAKGYWQNKERSMQDYVIPGGSMISTVKDTATFIRALNTGDLLSVDERSIYSSVYWFNHSGWLPGYQSVANYSSEIDAVVIQFINTTGGNSEPVADSTYKNILNYLSR